jgi:hypothetical protein
MHRSSPWLHNGTAGAPRIWLNGVRMMGSWVGWGGALRMLVTTCLVSNACVHSTPPHTHTSGPNCRGPTNFTCFIGVHTGEVKFVNSAFALPDSPEPACSSSQHVSGPPQRPHSQHQNQHQNCECGPRGGGGGGSYSFMCRCLVLEGRRPRSRLGARVRPRAWFRERPVF